MQINFKKVLISSCYFLQIEDRPDEDVTNSLRRLLPELPENEKCQFLIPSVIDLYTREVVKVWKPYYVKNRRDVKDEKDLMKYVKKVKKKKQAQNFLQKIDTELLYRFLEASQDRFEYVKSLKGGVLLFSQNMSCYNIGYCSHVMGEFNRTSKIPHILIYKYKYNLENQAESLKILSDANIPVFQMIGSHFIFENRYIFPSDRSVNVPSITKNQFLIHLGHAPELKWNGYDFEEVKEVQEEDKWSWLK